MGLYLTKKFWHLKGNNSEENLLGVGKMFVCYSSDKELTSRTYKGLNSKRQYD
jgi:hypothetical protein